MESASTVAQNTTEARNTAARSLQRHYAVLALCLALSACSHRSAAVEPIATDELTVEQEAPRPVFRYSVFPGGVRSAEELRSKLAADPIAKDHYEGFDVDTAQPLQGHGGRYYVSYRKYGHVYWTRTSVEIPSGEPVLYAAGQFVRVRCGNRLSVGPRLPVLPVKDEPLMEALDTIDDFAPADLPELPALKDFPLVAPPPTRQLAWTPNPPPMIADLGSDSHRVFSDPFMPGMLQGMQGAEGLATPPVPGIDTPAPATPLDPLPLPPIASYPVFPDGSRPTTPNPGVPVTPIPPGPIVETPVDPEIPIDPPIVQPQPPTCCEVIPPLAPEPPVFVPVPEPSEMATTGIALLTLAAMLRKVSRP